jgi:hypothetical protein
MISYVGIFPANTSEHVCLRRVVTSYAQSQAKEGCFAWILGDKGFESEYSSQLLESFKLRLVAMQSTQRLKFITEWDTLVIREKIRVNKRISKVRYVVERTFAWLMRMRRLTMNYERKDRNHAGFIKLAGIVHLLRRLVGKGG